MEKKNCWTMRAIRMKAFRECPWEKWDGCQAVFAVGWGPPPFDVKEKDGKPVINIDVEGKPRSFAPEEISAMVLGPGRLFPNACHTTQGFPMLTNALCYIYIN